MEYNNRSLQLKLLLDELETHRKNRNSQKINSYKSENYISLKLRMLTFGAVFLAILSVFFFGKPKMSDASTAANISLPFSYSFQVNGSLDEAANQSLSSSAYWWVESGARLNLLNGAGKTFAGNLSSGSSWYKSYAVSNPIATDNGSHPQNVFKMFLRSSQLNLSAQIYFKRDSDNLSNSVNKHAYNGESLFLRYVDTNNFYYAGVRADGGVVIKKKVNGSYQTLAYKKVLAGTYDSVNSPDLIPKNVWVGLKATIANDSSGNPIITLYMDQNNTGAWTQVLQVTDNPATYGAGISSAGLIGIQSDFADAEFDNFLLSNYGTAVTVISTSTPVTATTSGTTTTSTPVTTATSTPTTTLTVSSNYNSTILSDSPVMFLNMNSAASGSEIDQSGHSINGTYKGGTPISVALPNGDKASDFNGSSQYLTVPSNSALSIETTHQLTWEAWVRPDTFQFANASGDGYVDWMGKCENYSPTCEWESRIYGDTTPEGRPDRLSAYVFNTSAGLGSAADWQPSTNLKAGEWLHVVGEYQTLTTPTGCNTAYPGSINIWVNGVKQNASYHFPTGCMSQFSIVPKANNSPLNIGTMAMDTWFKGAVGKVAVYNYLLTQTQINNHFQAMTGASPSGSCLAECTIPIPTQTATIGTVTTSATTTSTATTTTVSAPVTTTTSTNLFSDSFSQYSDGLITNEYAYWNPTALDAKKSNIWEMTSGSLFASGSTGWTGVPNDGAPNALSTNGNNSSVFRLTTKEADFGDVAVTFDLLNQGLNSSLSTPAVDWDGVHIFLRYQSEYNLYYASINRRDNTVVIKKKVPGGPSNNGTYYNMSTYNTHAVPYNTWQQVKVTVKNNADGSVTIQLFANSVLVASMTDNGTVGGAPIRNAGKVGIRGDNDNFKFKNFTVTSF